MRIPNRNHFLHCTYNESSPYWYKHVDFEQEKQKVQLDLEQVEQLSRNKSLRDGLQ